MSCSDYPEETFPPTEKADFLVEECGCLFGIELIDLYRRDSGN